MNLKTTLFAISAWVLSLSAMAQVTYKTLPPLHVDGNHMKDEQGNIKGAGSVLIRFMPVIKASLLYVCRGFDDNGAYVSF